MKAKWKTGRFGKNSLCCSWESALIAVVTFSMLLGLWPATAGAVWDPPAPPPIKVDVQINTVKFLEDQDDGGGDAEVQLIWVVNAGRHGGATGTFSKDDLNADDFDDEIAIWSIFGNVWTHEECFPRSEVTLTTRLFEMDTIASDETLRLIVTAAIMALTEGKLPVWAEGIPGIGELVEKLKDAVVELIKEVGSWINSNDDLGKGLITWGDDGFYDFESKTKDGSVPATINAGLITTIIYDQNKYNMCLYGEVPAVDAPDVSITIDAPVDTFPATAIDPAALLYRQSTYPINLPAEDMFSTLKMAVATARTIEAEVGNPDQLTDEQVQDIRDTYTHIALGLAEVISGTYVEAASDFSGVETAVSAFQKGRQLAAGGDINGAIDAYRVAYYAALQAIESRVAGGTRLPLQVTMVSDIVSTEYGKRPLLLVSVLGADSPQLDISGLPAGVEATVIQSDQTLGIFMVDMDIGSQAEPGAYPIECLVSDGTREAIRKLELIINGPPDLHPPQTGTLFLDDFESDEPGGLPGNWDLVYNGRGDSYQVVSEAYAVSGSQAFQLWGRNGWSAVAQRMFAADAAQIGFRYKILIEDHGDRHEEHAGFFKNHGESYWGTYYATVRFDHVTGQILAEDGTILGEWDPGVWYDVRVQLNRDEKTYVVSIDGKKVGSNLPINASFPDLIDAIALVSGHAGVKVFYDDVEVFISTSDADIDSDGDGIPDADDLCPDLDFEIIDVNFDGCPDTPEDIAIFLGEDPVELIVRPGEDSPYVLRWKNYWIYFKDFNLLKRLAELLEEIEAIRAATDMDVREKLKAIRYVCKEAEIIARYALQEAIEDLGADHPDVIEALKLFKRGLENVASGRYEETVESFRQSVLALSGEPNPSLKVEIMPRWDWEIDTETFAAVYEWVWLPIRVTNDGNVDLKDVSVDQSHSGFFETIDLLRAGGSVTLNAGLYLDCSLYQVEEDSPDPFTIMTTASGFAAMDGAGQSASGSARCKVDVIHPQLGINIKGPEMARVGSIISFEIEVVNQGDVPLYDILVEEHAYYPTLQLLIQIKSLQPGESQHYFYHYYVTEKDRDSILVSLHGSARRPFDSGIDYELVSRTVYAAESHRVKVVRPVIAPTYPVPIKRPKIIPIRPRPVFPIPGVRTDSRTNLRTTFRNMRRR